MVGVAPSASVEAEIPDPLAASGAPPPAHKVEATRIERRAGGTRMRGPVQGTTRAPELRPRRMRVERARPRLERKGARRPDVTHGTGTQGVPTRTTVRMGAQGGPPPRAAPIPEQVPRGVPVGTGEPIRGQTAPVLVRVRVLNEGQMARQPPSPTYQGVVLPASSDLAHPTDTVPVGLTRRASSVARAPHEAEA